VTVPRSALAEVLAPLQRAESGAGRRRPRAGSVLSRPETVLKSRGASCQLAYVWRNAAEAGRFGYGSNEAVTKH
jgi:hypothetical protein